MDILIEIIFGRIIVGIFGYYSLFMFYSLTGNKQKLEWIKTTRKEDEAKEVASNFVISIVGLIVFTMLFILICYVGDWILNQ